jgi:AcrR family transcriptional regulator
LLRSKASTIDPIEFDGIICSMIPRRSAPYGAAQRRLQSAGLRQRIVDEAGELFLAPGYRTTTIADIASAAGVNPDTVYRLVGRKPMVLRELIEQALSGTDHAVAGADRSYVRAMAAEPDAIVRLEIYAAAVREIHGRMAPLFVALRDASSTEPEAEQVWKEIGERLPTCEGSWDARSAKPAQYETNRRGGRLQALNSSEVYVMLTVERAARRSNTNAGLLGVSVTSCSSNAFL